MSDSIKDLVKLQDNICLSGGAAGADLQWGMNAGRAGHAVIHWGFLDHRSDAPEQEIVRLSRDQLAVADPFLERANKSLKRRWPSSADFTNNLLRRNYYQVMWATAVYAVGTFKNGEIQGGTSWATQMYMDRFTIDGEPLELCQLYFYDQNLSVWMQWKGSWTTLTGAPRAPSGVWAGIGSRTLTENGKWAIRELWGWMRPTEE
jgi:hypothetical protein